MKYRIKPGFTLLDSDGSHKTGGDMIDLSQDFILANPEKVESVPSATLEIATVQESTGY